MKKHHHRLQSGSCQVHNMRVCNTCEHCEWNIQAVRGDLSVFEQGCDLRGPLAQHFADMTGENGQRVNSSHLEEMRGERRLRGGEETREDRRGREGKRERGTGAELDRTARRDQKFPHIHASSPPPCCQDPLKKTSMVKPSHRVGSSEWPAWIHHSRAAHPSSHSPANGTQRWAKWLRCPTRCGPDSTIACRSQCVAGQRGTGRSSWFPPAESP